MYLLLILSNKEILTIFQLDYCGYAPWFTQKSSHIYLLFIIIIDCAPFHSKNYSTLVDTINDLNSHPTN